jgi:hypothetical protein
MKKENWIWMPHAAHFICGQCCQYHLATYVGRWVVSTVGDYFPNGPDGDRKTVGCDRFYETMVFRASRMPAGDPNCSGCKWVQESGTHVDFEGYNDAGEATRGHLAMCEKWSKIRSAQKSD